MDNQSDRSGVAVFPPLLMALALLVMLMLHWLWPLPVPMRPLAQVLGIVLGILGIAGAVWGRNALVKGGTNVSPLKPTTAIVMSGPYRFTRNPLYVGAMTLLIGLSLIIGTWWGFVVLVPLLPILHFGVILREERYLEQKFGESYLRYKGAVRRYL
jgi:protein-S-isoprenylcysteine O-methyltransferase Ste14